jgi:hypothetical protein
VPPESRCGDSLSVTAVTSGCSVPHVLRRQLVIVEIVEFDPLLVVIAPSDEAILL